MSARPSIWRWPRACSGDMKAGVPPTRSTLVGAGGRRPTSVGVGLHQAEVEHLDEVDLAADRQMKMLAGLMSRWTSPVACASASE